MNYAELHCHSAFTQLDGASEPEELVARGIELGLAGLALTDQDELGGAVRFQIAAREAGEKLHVIFGAELTVRWPGDERINHLTLLAENERGWRNLSALITKARMETDRGEPAVSLEALAARAEGLVALTGCPRGPVAWALRDGDRNAAAGRLGTLVDLFPGSGRLHVEVWDHGLPEERGLVGGLLGLSRRLDVPALVTNDVHYARPDQRTAHDVLTCLKHGITLDRAATRLRPNGEWYLKSPAEMAARWFDHPDLLEATVKVAGRCRFDLSSLRPALPAFSLDPDDPRWRDVPYPGDGDFLRDRVCEGAAERWPEKGPGTPEWRQLEHELEVIEQLGLAGYFLIVWDVVRYARREGILCQGRGSAANSAVCYCLGITAIDPVGMDLLFERFLSMERNEAPDIDIDIAHRERERVLQYVYRRYGRDRAGMVCESICFRARSAVRDAARVLGFSSEQGGALADEVDGWIAYDGYEAYWQAKEPPRDAPPASGAAGKLARERGNALRAAGVDPGDGRVRTLLQVVRGLEGLPRHRSIHVGGFVLTDGPLGEIVPVEPASMADRTVIQYDKDDLEPVGLVKIDLLGLGMLTVLQDVFALLRARGVALELHTIPMDDAAVYDQICEADVVGLFQIESRAQMNTLPRLRPRNFYDLVVEVALIRPGPIQGDMVHPYLRRRRGEEPVTYLHPSLEPVLARTLGVPLFQEQGMKVAIVAAGFTPGQADELRRAMGFKRAYVKMRRLAAMLLEGMLSNGIDRDTAERIVKQLAAFADYGFPESHSASFALLVYASAWLRHYYPAEYLAAMLNAQPMGFYAPATLVQDARRHGVEVRPPCILRSRWDCTLEEGAVRIGLRYVRGLGDAAKEKLDRLWASPGPSTLEEVVRRTGLEEHNLLRLARAGAFEALRPGRNEAAWEVLRWARQVAFAGTLADAPPRGGDPTPMLPGLDERERLAVDYATTGMSTGKHAMELLRSLPDARRWTLAANLGRVENGRRARVAGHVITRQRPPTAKGFFFLTLEDETGYVNVIVTPRRFDRSRRVLVGYPLLVIEGVVQKEQGVVNLRGERFWPLEPPAGAVPKARDFH